MSAPQDTNTRKAAWIAAQLEKAPPLKPSQRDRLTAILRSSVQDAA